MPIRIPRLRSYTTLLTWPLWSTGVAIFVNDHLAEVLSIRGQSMAPTLSPDYHETGAMDYLLLQKWFPTLHMRRGDVISFWAPHKPEHLVVKRVVGLEGDLVFLDRRRWRGEQRNQERGSKREEEETMAGDMRKLASTGWAGDEEGSGMGIERQAGAVRVPPGHVWVEGDNWRESGDSNFYGPISRSLITGRALCVVWPWSKFGEQPWETPRKKSRTRVQEGNFKPLPR